MLRCDDAVSFASSAVHTDAVEGEIDKCTAECSQSSEECQVNSVCQAWQDLHVELEFGGSSNFPFRLTS